MKREALLQRSTRRLLSLRVPRGASARCFCPRCSPRLVFGCQGTCLSPPASASPLLLGTSGHGGPAPCARLPVGRGGTRLARAGLARTPASCPCGRAALETGSAPRSPRAALREEQRRETLSISRQAVVGAAKHQSARFFFFFGGVEGGEGWDAQTGLFSSCTRCWVWADDFSPCSLLNAALLHKEVRFSFFFFLFAVQIQILQTGPSVNSLLRCSVHIKL